MPAYWKLNDMTEQLVRIDVEAVGVNAILTITDQATGDKITEITTDDTAQIAALKRDVGTTEHDAYIAS